MKKEVLLLGSTGSIGKQTVDVLKMHADRFSVLGLSCKNDVETLYVQANELRPKYVAAEAPIDRDRLPEGTEIFTGPDAANFITMALKRFPDLDEAEELKTWRDELMQHMAEDAYVQAKFYDTKQRTRHAALTAWERFLKEYPASPHADEARARVEALGGSEELRVESEE